MTFVPLMVPLLLAVPFGPMLAWKRGDLAGAAQRLYVAIGAAMLAMTLCFAFLFRGPWLAPLGFAIGVWLIAGAIADAAQRVKLGRQPVVDSLRRFAGLPRSAHGSMLAHLGLGLSILGIVATSAWSSERILSMAPGAKAEIAGYEVAFEGVVPRTGPNYDERVGAFRVSAGGREVARLEPAKRAYRAERQTTTEAGIHAALAGDLYVVLGDAADDGSHTVRLYFNPLVRLIWIGAVVMFVGGALSLSDRRLRVGAPRRSAAAKPAAG
jgi:cytochrome c-type biogenesis protein CcmF